MSNYAIGVDIGTTSTKAVLFSREGKSLCQSSVEYPMHHPEPKASEQDPDEILEAVITSIRELMKKSGSGQKQYSAYFFQCGHAQLYCRG